MLQIYQLYNNPKTSEQPTVCKVILTTFGQQVDFLTLRRVRQILVQAGTSFTFEFAVFGFISRKNFLYL